MLGNYIGKPRAVLGYDPVFKVTPVTLHGVASPDLTRGCIPRCFHGQRVSFWKTQFNDVYYTNASLLPVKIVNITGEDLDCGVRCRAEAT